LEETLFQKGFFQEDFFCPATIYLEIYSILLPALRFPARFPAPIHAGKSGCGKFLAVISGKNSH
jgi:hypothetical protein